MTNYFAQIVEQYRPQVTQHLWEEARGSVRIAPEIAAVIGERPPDSFKDELPERHGPSWLEERAKAWLFFVHIWFDEMRRERHRRYFKWNTEPMVGCWVWVDDEPVLVRRLTVEEASNWKSTDD